MAKLSALDRFILSLSPGWGASRQEARARAARNLTAQRHYEAAATGRRTSGWSRQRGDANSLIATALPELRMHARDLQRNNSYAKRGLNIIANNTVGWGIVPKAVDGSASTAELWKTWGDSTQCDAEGRLTIAGIQRLVMGGTARDGEMLIRRRWRRVEDGLAVPLQLQVLESEMLDTSKESDANEFRGPTIQGIEFNKIGQRVAYWIFPTHPGGRFSTGESKRTPASEIIHVYDLERAGQCRGISWLATAVLNLKDLDEYEDAELMKQKIAACFAAFVVDTEGTSSPIGDLDTDDDTESFEPGMIHHLAEGKDVRMANPPGVTADTFAIRNLRKLAAGMGVTYEDLTGDYSGVNFSSARMGRIAHYENVKHWRWNMLVPQLCNGIWSWFVEALVIAGALKAPVAAEWTAPPMPMIEPDKEGLAISRNVRSGLTTPSEMIREQGGDPEAHWQEYAADMKRLDALGIKLDSDVRAVSQAGLTQERAGAGEKPGEKPPAAKERSLEPDDDVSDEAVRQLLDLEGAL